MPFRGNTLRHHRCRNIATISRPTCRPYSYALFKTQSIYLLCRHYLSGKAMP